MDAVKVNLQNSNAANSISSDASKKQDKVNSASGGFSSVLDQSINSKSASYQSVSRSSSKDNTVPAAKTSNQKSEKKDSTATKTDASSKTDSSSKSNATKSTKNTKASKATKASKVKDEIDTAVEEVTNEYEEIVPEVSEELMTVLSQVLTAMDALKELVQQQLGLDDSQFDAALRELDMTTADLFDPINLKEFFLQVNGADTAELLTNEQLANDLSGLVQQMEELDPSKDLELSKEDIKKMMELLDSMNSNKEVNQEKVEKPEHLEHYEETQDENKMVTNTNHTQVRSNSNQSSQSGNDSSQHGNSSQSKVKTDMKFVVNGTADVSNQTKASFMDQLAATAQTREIINQIVQEIRVSVTQEHASMQMVLHPESLGRVQLTVTAKNGVLTAHIVAETQEAKDAIESQISVLKDTFQQQGLKVDAVEVSVAANDFNFMNQSQNNQKEQDGSREVKKGQSRLKLGHGLEAEDDDEEQTEVPNVSATIGKGTQIDITA